MAGNHRRVNPPRTPDLELISCQSSEVPACGQQGPAPYGCLTLSGASGAQSRREEASMAFDPRIARTLRANRLPIRHCDSLAHPGPLARTNCRSEPSRVLLVSLAPPRANRRSRVNAGSCKPRHRTPDHRGRLDISLREAFILIAKLPHAHRAKGVCGEPTVVSEAAWHILCEQP